MRWPHRSLPLYPIVNDGYTYTDILFSNYVVNKINDVNIFIPTFSFSVCICKQSFNVEDVASVSDYNKEFCYENFCNGGMLLCGSYIVFPCTKLGLTSSMGNKIKFVNEFYVEKIYLDFKDIFDNLSKPKLQ